MSELCLRHTADARTSPAWGRIDRTRSALFIGLTSVLLVWLHWPMLQEFQRRWASDPQYSHGPLIPLMAVGLVWLRGIPTADPVLRPTWQGLPLLVIGVCLRQWASYFYYEWLEWISLVPTVAGACWMVTGWPLFRHLLPAITFLVFMIPLPYRFEVAVLQPLQNMATRVATVSLQTLGFMARAQGNVVWIGETAVGVAQACSGLRMLTGFLALAVAVVLIVEREVWKRAVLLLSAVPVALICNVVRVTTMGIVHSATSSETLQTQLHDGLGWAMPLMAAGLLWGELKLLDALLIMPDETAEKPLLAASCSGLSS